jgi:restriction endonuclease Mrr
LFGDIKPVKKEEPKKVEEKQETRPTEIKPVQKQEQKPKQEKTEKRSVAVSVKKPRSATADEKLQDAFLKKLRRLGGDYFEYYSVYLLEKYSRRNGRRLEGLKISGGGHDGGIDGEIELTDRLGFRETIYIQAKNWDPDKGDERLWTVGETLLQQFIGACVCRQAKDGKQHCRGIFITTSRFTPEAKRILEETSDKFVGYDGTDLFEAAKECEFGIIRKNGEWALDENLLSGERALFHIL